METQWGSLKSPLCVDGCLGSLGSCSALCFHWCFGVWFVLLCCKSAQAAWLLAWLSNSCECVGVVNLLGWDGGQ